MGDGEAVEDTGTQKTTVGHHPGQRMERTESNSSCLFPTGSGEIPFGLFGCQILRGYVEVHVWVSLLGCKTRDRSKKWLGGEVKMQK